MTFPGRAGLPVTVSPLPSMSRVFVLREATVSGETLWQRAVDGLESPKVDVGPARVYADWLLEQGRPEGEVAVMILKFLDKAVEDVNRLADAEDDQIERARHESQTDPDLRRLRGMGMRGTEPEQPTHGGTPEFGSIGRPIRYYINMGVRRALGELCAPRDTDMMKRGAERLAEAVKGLQQYKTFHRVLFQGYSSEGPYVATGLAEPKGSMRKNILKDLGPACDPKLMQRVEALSRHATHLVQKLPRQSEPFDLTRAVRKGKVKPPDAPSRGPRLALKRPEEG